MAREHRHNTHGPYDGGLECKPGKKRSLLRNVSLSVLVGWREAACGAVVWNVTLGMV
jgi:hypothetical protein